MSRIFGGLLILTLGLTAPAAQDKQPTPKEQLRALSKEYGPASLGFRNATTDEERKKAVEDMDRFALRFLELAEKYPDDPIALDILLEVVRTLNAVDSLTQVTWEMNKSAYPVRRKDATAARAVATLERHHLKSDKLGPVCLRMTYGVRPEFEAFLDKALKTNPHQDVRAISCLALGQFLNFRMQKLVLIQDRPDFARRYDELFGKERYSQLQPRDRAKLAADAESLFEQAATTYGDVKHPYGFTIGAQAKKELFEFRHLTVGKQAPDIEGEDQDGKKFKLSDYRGKVVLLDFWQEL